MAMDLNIVNNALVIAAQNPVSSLSTASETVAIVELFYEDEIQDTFESFKWDWCTVVEPLIRVNKTTAQQDAERKSYRDLVQYERPADLRSIVDIWITDAYRQSVEFYPTELAIYGPLEELTIRYIREVPVNKYPVWFKKVIESAIGVRLAERFKVDKVEQLIASRDDKFNRAKKADLRQRGSNVTLGKANAFTGIRNRFDGGSELRKDNLYRTSLRYNSGE